MPSQNTNYSLELQRILNSSLPNQVLKQLSKNQTEINYMEQTVTMKNQQINSLHERLKEQINTINQLIKVNDQLSEENASIKKSFRMLKEQLNDFKGTCISMLQGYLIRQKQSILKKVNLAIQSYLLQNQNHSLKDENQVFQKQLQTSKQIAKKKNQYLDKNFQTQAHFNKNLQILSVINLQVNQLRGQQKLRSFQCQTDQEQQFTTQTRRQENDNNQNIEKEQQIFKIVHTLEQQISTLRNEKHQISQQLKQIRQQMNKQINNQKLKKQLQQKNNTIQVQNQSLNFDYRQYQSIATSLNEDQTVQIQCANQQDQKQTIKMVLQNIQRLVEIKFIGQMLDGHKNGLAICQFQNEWHFQGNYQNNQRHGLGTLFYKQKKIYYGNWSHNQIEGTGIFYYFNNSQIYQISGNFKNGVLQGYGTIKFKSGYNIKCKFEKGVPQTQFNKCLLSFSRQVGVNQKNNNKKNYYGRIVSSEFGDKFQTIGGEYIQLY